MSGQSGFGGLSAWLRKVSTDVRTGKTNIWLLVAIAFSCGFFVHAIFFASGDRNRKDGTAWEVGGIGLGFGSGSSMTTDRARTAGELTESRGFVPPVTFVTSESGLLEDTGMTATERNIFGGSADISSASSGSEARSQHMKPSQPSAAGNSNVESTEPQYVGPHKEPANRAARKEECHRWQSNIEERRAFDNLVNPGKPATAQHSQDVVMFKTLLNPSVLGRDKGFYIDLAANLPRSLSNTYFLDVCRGWTGLCIEAQPEIVAKLKDRQRWGRSCTIIDTCVADKPGVEVDFVLSGGIGGIDGVRSTIQDTEWIERMKTIGHEHLLTDNKMKSVKMTCTTVESEIRKLSVDAFPGGAMSDGRKVVDFMSLDIEGAELMAIKGTNFDEVFIRYILLELAPLYKEVTNRRIPYNEQPFHDALELLKARGFSLLMRLNLDVLLVHKDAIPDINMEKLRATCNRNHVSLCLMCEDALEEDMCVGVHPRKRRVSRPH